MDNDKKKGWFSTSNLYIGFISSVIGIFVFVTGISSCPEMFRKKPITIHPQIDSTKISTQKNTEKLPSTNVYPDTQSKEGKSSVDFTPVVPKVKNPNSGEKKQPHSAIIEYNVKDIRVAKDLNRATLEFVILLKLMIDNEDRNKGDAIYKLFREEKIDDPLTRNIEKQVIPYFNSKKLLTPSGIKINEKSVNWAEYLIYQLNEIIKRCDKILDRYADRDEGLIENVHLVQGESSNIRDAISLSLINISTEKDTIIARLIRENLSHKAWMENYIKVIHASRKQCYEFYDES